MATWGRGGVCVWEGDNFYTHAHIPSPWYLLILPIYLSYCGAICSWERANPLFPSVTWPTEVPIGNPANHGSRRQPDQSGFVAGQSLFPSVTCPIRLVPPFFFPFSCNVKLPLCRTVANAQKKKKKKIDPPQMWTLVTRGGSRTVSAKRER